MLIKNLTIVTRPRAKVFAAWTDNLSIDITAGSLEELMDKLTDIIRHEDHTNA